MSQTRFFYWNSELRMADFGLFFPDGVETRKAKPPVTGFEPVTIRFKMLVVTLTTQPYCPLNRHYGYSSEKRYNYEKLIYLEINILKCKILLFLLL